MSWERIVVFGPPMSGKTELCRTIAVEYDGVQELAIYPSISGLMTPRGLRVRLEHGGLSLVVETVSGAVWECADWGALFDERPDGVILLLDSHPSRYRQNLEWTQFLQGVYNAARPGVVVMSKTDLIPSPDLEDLVTWCPAWPRFATRNDERDSLLSPFEYLLDKLL